MRLREIFRYEVEYRRRSAPTWIYAGILFLVAIWFFLALADEGPEAFVNAPERIAGVSVIVGTFGMLVSAAIFGEAAVRDVAVEMDALLFTSPLRKAEYLVGRFPQGAVTADFTSDDQRSASWTRAVKPEKYAPAVTCCTSTLNT